MLIKPIVLQNSYLLYYFICMAARQSSCYPTFAAILKLILYFSILVITYAEHNISFILNSGIVVPEYSLQYISYKFLYLFFFFQLFTLSFIYPQANPTTVKIIANMANARACKNICSMLLILCPLSFFLSCTLCNSFHNISWSFCFRCV